MNPYKIKAVLALFIFLLGGVSTSFAREENIFHSRDFWKKNPSVEQVQKEESMGSSTEELNSFGFDAMVYAILEDASMDVFTYLLSKEGNAIDKVTHDKRSYFMWAGYKGNLPLLQLLLEKGSDVSWTDIAGFNTFTFAAAGGVDQIEVYDFLLANGGKITDTDSKGANCLLLLAPKAKKLDLLDYFVQKGCSIQAKDAKGNGLIAYASSMGNTEVISWAISKGVDPKLISSDGTNALFFAARGGRGTINTLSFFQYLVQLGVYPKQVSNEGETVLQAMIRNQKDKAVFDFFLSLGVDVQAKNSQGENVLHLACKFNNSNAFSYFLPLIKEWDVANNEGKSPLFLAAENFNLEMLQILQQKGAKMNYLDGRGNDLYHLVFAQFQARKNEEFLQTLTFLDSQKVKRSEQNAEGNTLLHLAVEKQDEKAVLEALKRVKNKNVLNQNGLSALHLAAMQSQDLKVLQLLVDQGLDLTITTEFDETVYQLASENELINSDLKALQFLKK